MGNLSNLSVQAALKYMCHLFNSSCSIQAKKKENTYFSLFRCPVLVYIKLLHKYWYSVMLFTALYRAQMNLVPTNLFVVSQPSTFCFVLQHFIGENKICLLHVDIIFCSFMICPKSAELSSDLSIIHHLAIKHHQSNLS